MKSLDAREARRRLQTLRWRPRRLESDPWIRASAVLAAFDPVAIRPAGPDGEGRHLLLEHSHPVAGADWVLDDAVRRSTLRSMWREGAPALRSARAANEVPLTPRQRALDALLNGEPFAEGIDASAGEIRALLTVLPWVRDLDLPRPDPRRLQDRLRQADLVESLKRLTEGFFDRPDERRAVHEWLTAPGPGLLVVHGEGGAGKSTVVARALLDLDEAGTLVTWMYVDLDRSTVDPRSPAALAQEMARQLSARRPGLAAALDGLRADGPRGTAPGGTGWTLAADRLGSALGEPSLRPVLVVDTFERARALGPEAVLGASELLHRLMARCPIRVVVVARTPVPELTPHAGLHVGELDAGRAKAVLRDVAGEVPDAVAEEVLGIVGANPLSVTLAGEVLREAGCEASGDPHVHEALLAQVRSTHERKFRRARIEALGAPRGRPLGEGEPGMPTDTGSRDV